MPDLGLHASDVGAMVAIAGLFACYCVTTAPAPDPQLATRDGSSLAELAKDVHEHNHADECEGEDQHTVGAPAGVDEDRGGVRTRKHGRSTDGALRATVYSQLDASRVVSSLNSACTGAASPTAGPGCATAQHKAHGRTHVSEPSTQAVAAHAGTVWTTDDV